MTHAQTDGRRVTYVIMMPGPQPLPHPVGDLDELAAVADIQRALLRQGLSITSVIRPGRGDITTILVDRYTASGIEWVTKPMVLPVRAHSFSSLFVQPVAHDLIQRAEGFVHQQDIGIKGQRPGDAGPLLHAARKLPGKLLAEARQAPPDPAPARPARPARPWKTP